MSLHYSNFSFFIGARRRAGFTLVELLISMSILVILMMMVTQVVGIVQRTWVRSNSRVSQFREARIAFDAISRNVSQATLNAYWESEFSNVGTDRLGQQVTQAKNYVRKSELQFICGPTSTLLTSAASKSENYPGHAVFFQAPLGVARILANKTGTGGTSSSSTASNQADTENMVNLLCGRGYFVEWGSDTAFRPSFLSTINTVPTRSRMRLMEYSPTSEQNRIYMDSLRPITEHSKQWFQDAIDSQDTNNTQTASNRAFTRPIADNILALIISPQIETKNGSNLSPTGIAPNYTYDSTLVSSPGATIPPSLGPQGYQHLLPPLLKITMVALDQRGGETISSNSTVRDAVLNEVKGMFKSVSQADSELGAGGGTQSSTSQGTLETLLIKNKIGYRIFSTTVSLKQARWSM